MSNNFEKLNNRIVKCNKCDRLEIQISEQSTRHDAVVLKLSNTIERQQLMIGESKSSGLFQKLFGWMTG